MVPGVEVGPEKRKEMTPKKERRVNHGKGKGAHPEKEKEVAPGKEKETTTSEKEGEAVQERKVSQKRERGAAREKESVVSHGRDGENILGKETVHVTASGTGPETDVDQEAETDGTGAMTDNGIVAGIETGGETGTGAATMRIRRTGNGT